MGVALSGNSVMFPAESALAGLVVGAMDVPNDWPFAAASSRASAHEGVTTASENAAAVIEDTAREKRPARNTFN